MELLCLPHYPDNPPKLKNKIIYLHCFNIHTTYFIHRWVPRLLILKGIIIFDVF